MEDPTRVAPQLANLAHAGVLPYAELVVDEAVGGEDLTLVWVPLE